MNTVNGGPRQPVASTSTANAAPAPAAADDVEVIRHSQKNDCGKIKSRNPFHRRSHHAKVIGKGDEPVKVACQLPEARLQIHGSMRTNCNKTTGQTHTFEVLRFEYPGQCPTIPMEYVVAGREHHVTAPDIVVSGCHTVTIKPILRFEPDTIHVYPGNVHDERGPLTPILGDCQQDEYCSPKGPAKGDDSSSSSSSSSSAVPVAGPSKGGKYVAPAKGEEPKPDKGKGKEVVPEEEDTSTSSQSSASPVAAPVKKPAPPAPDEAQQGEVQQGSAQSNDQVAPFPAKKHHKFNIFRG